MGRQARRRPHQRAATNRASQAQPLPAGRRRRGRLHPVRTRSGEPVLPTRLQPLRTRQHDRHLQQAVRTLGRSLRRRCRRRRHDRPARPPRRSRLPPRRLLPAQEPRPRPGPSRHGRLRMNPELVKFHLPVTDQFSVAVDRPGCSRRKPQLAHSCPSHLMIMGQSARNVRYESASGLCPRSINRSATVSTNGVGPQT
jgi:hypothetical protein